ncbi:MAG: hypothetical protein ACRD0P_09720 [Stackebrandtia sp.]
MESDGNEPELPPQVRNEMSGATGRDSYQAQHMDLSRVTNVIQQQEPPPKVTPRGLPPAPQLFVNRMGPTTEVKDWVTDTRNTSAPVVLVSGSGGVGCSAFAVQWGHRVGPELYPDGTLYADMREHRVEGGAAVAAVLAKFLESCGWQERDVPTDMASRRERFRSYTHDKKLLVVVDHVESAAEVDALCPTSPGSTLIATSFRMDEFVAGQRYLSLKPLSDDAAVELLTELIGAERVAAEPAEVAELVRLCGGAPKVLSLAVGFMRRHPSMTVAEVNEDVRTELALPGSVGDKSILDVVASRAYASLSADAARVYRQLCWHPGLDVSRAAILALADSNGGNGGRVIRDLVDHHLLDEHQPRRYRLSSLVRAHARAQALSLDGDDSERQALSVLVPWYEWQAQAADLKLNGQRTRVFSLDDSVTVPFEDAQAAGDWQDAERRNLLALQRRCLDLDWFSPVQTICEALSVRYHSALYLEDWLESGRLAVAAAEAAGDNRSAEVRMRCFLGRALMEMGEYGESEAELDLARGLCTDEVDPVLLASAIEFKGLLLSQQERYGEALSHFRKARGINAGLADGPDASPAYRRLNRRAMALQDHFIGQTLLVLGESEHAVRRLRSAESLFAEYGSDRDATRIGTDLGAAYLATGDVDAALATLTNAVMRVADKNWYCDESAALWQLATAARSAGDETLERTCLERLRVLYGAIHSPDLAAVEEWLAGLPE